MRTKRIVGLFLFVGALVLSGCDSSFSGSSSGTTKSTSSTSTTSTSGSTGTNTTTNTTTTTTTTTPTNFLGSGSGTSFQNGVLTFGLSTISAGGLTQVTATVVDASYNPVTTPQVSVSFSSPCISQGLATINTPAATDPTTGIASASYTATGCTGSDQITATATVNQQTITAIGTLTILPPTVGSVTFVSATPTQIGLKGSGLGETSNVVFKVVDKFGWPVSNQAVDFSLNSSVGGVTLANSSGITGVDGQVTATVNAGTVSCTVKVTATIPNTSPVLGSQSASLVISTGLADELHVYRGIGVKSLNPEAGDYLGVTDVVTVVMSDHYGNPVPDGTAVYFTAEAGQIDSSCTISKGTCSVTWTSASPIPADGRATILATIQGEETFYDGNSDGIKEDNENFDDQGEAFRDDNENGIYDYGEFFVDENNNGLYDGPDGLYNGMLCTGTQCSTKKTIIDSAETVIVMSHSTANPSAVSEPSDPSAVTSFSCANGATVSGNVYIGDVSVPSQPLPAGTSLKFVLTNGLLLAPSASPATVTVPDGATIQPIPVTIKGDGSGVSTFLTVTVTTPKGVVSTVRIPVQN